ncbi:MAG: hypothetical protein FJ271_20555 [Planctomycetes bacterium]|nr:hypothetical protein [Planctomycetota bacterium]
MRFRQAYLDSLDVSLARLQQELDDIAAVTASFLHLSGDEFDEPAPRKVLRGPRHHYFPSSHWHIDDPAKANSLVSPFAIGPQLSN